MEVVGWFALFFFLPAPSASPKGISSQNTCSSREAPLALSLASKKRIFGEDRAVDIPDDVFPSEKALAELERGMEDCEHGWMESCFEGAQLHYRKWTPKSTTTKPKGVVLWLHGIAAHSGRSLVMEDDNNRKLGMALMRETWLKEGYALYALDYYGHGYSEGLRWFVPKFEVNRDDIIAFTKLVAAEHEEHTPMILTAESYGGCLALHVAKHFQENPSDAPKGFDSIILHAPAIIPPDLPPKPVISLLTTLSRSYPTWIPFFMPNPVSTTRIWKDPKVLNIFDSQERRAMRIEGGGKPFRLATAVSMLLAMEQARDAIIPGLTVPFCVIHGEKDIAVPISGTEYLLEYAATSQGNRAVQRHPEAYHDLMADPTAEETMKFMIDFANDRIATATKK